MGDITKLIGAELPPVWMVTGGSPCQDLSVAGKRAGLGGARSGLFMEQIRVIKELREHDRAAGRTGKSIRPRFMAWENVPGALSSNKGEDFRAVIEETCRIADDTVSIPLPKKGKWASVGSIVGDGYSVAYRIIDAQYRGVPQRRRRIFLVADFAGECAAEILFKPYGVSWHPAQSGEAWQVTSGIVEDCIGETGCLTPRDAQGKRIFSQWGGAPMFSGSDGGGGRNPAGIVLTAAFSAGQGVKAGGIGYADELSPTLKAAGGGNQVPCVCIPELARALTARYDSSPCFDRGQNVIAVYDARGNGNGVTVPTMTGDHNGHISDFTAVAVLPFDTTQITSPQNKSDPHYGDLCYSILSGAHPPAIVEKAYCIAGNTIDRKVKNGGNGSGVQADISYTLNTVDRHSVLNLTTYQQTVGALCASDKNGIGNQYVEQGKCVVEFSHTMSHRVRRLTPLECERLQGFPDGWTDIPDYEVRQLIKHGKRTGEYRTITRKCTDGVRYKALGNSVAIPCVEYVIGNIADYLRAEGVIGVTLGSLFDGIGGFPLAGLRHGVTPLWASEIEPFPIAVTKYHLKCANEELDTY